MTPIDKQQLAIQKVIEGKNIFLTGLAGCVDKDTEFLSPNGWKPISEYYEGDLVGQISEIGLNLSFIEPLKYIKLPCKEFNHITSERGIDQKLCDSHSVAYTVKDKEKLNKINILKLLDISTKNKSGFSGKIPQTFKYSGSNIPFKTDDEIRLAVALKADGSLATSSTGRFVINLKRRSKIDRILYLLKSANKDFSIIKRKDGYFSVSVWFKECTKNLNQFWLCSEDTAKVVFSEISYWDGSLDKRTNLPMFFTTKKEEADTCQYIFSILGYKSNIFISDRRGRVRNLNGKDYTTKSIDYKVICSKQTNIGMMSINKGVSNGTSERVKSLDGFKYCFTVPTGFLLLRRENKIFVTGNCGKSYTTRKIMELSPHSTVVCAPTGTAALNIGGMTAHKMFGLPIGIPTEAEVNTIKRGVKALFSKRIIKTIIIDEISMLRADYLDIIDFKLKKIRGNSKPFGGLQMVVVGDFFQLDPVVPNSEAQHYYQKYCSAFCFDANSWDFETVELDKPYRTTDERQTKILNSIRKKDKHHKLAVQRLNDESKQYSYSEDILHLCCYKKDAVRINFRCYSVLKGEEKKYQATFTGNWGDAPVEELLNLKVGCKVILRANCQEGEFVNGDRGTITSLFTNSAVVELLNGKSVHVAAFKWEKFKYVVTKKVIVDENTKEEATKEVLTKEVESSFKQLPLRLGYAITGHAAQGSTLEDVALDFGRGAFTHGQAYCMLSRVKDTRNIRLVKPLTARDIICNTDVVEFYEEEK